MKKYRKLRIKLFGRVFDSSSLSAKGVEILGQQDLDKIAPNCFILKVTDFDFYHISFRLYRNLKEPGLLSGLHKQPNEMLQTDQMIVFPELPTTPTHGGRIIVVADCAGIVEDLNIRRNSYKGSKLHHLNVFSTKDYIDVEISK